MIKFLSAIFCIVWFCAPLAHAQFKLGSSSFDPKIPKPDESKETPTTTPASQPAVMSEAPGGAPTTQPFIALPVPATGPSFVENTPTTTPSSRPTTRVVLELPKIPLPGAKADPPKVARETATRPVKTYDVPDFPPGLFSDGNQYRLSDLQGKSIVLFFFDPRDDRAVATIPQRLALMRKFQNKPIAFFGIQADTIHDVSSSARSLGLPIPIFADTLGVMMARYRATLSPNKSWHVVIIDGDGKQAHEEMTEAAIEKSLEKAGWKFRDRPWDTHLGPALDAFEMGNFERGMRILSSWFNDKKVCESARQLEAVIKTLAEDWRAQAEQLSATDPVAAYDLYARIMACFPNSELSRSVADSFKKLGQYREVRAELSARYMYGVLCAAVSRDEMIQKWDAAGYCEEIIRACPGTPTGEKLVKYLDDLGKVKERGQNNRSNRPGRRGFAG